MSSKDGAVIQASATDSNALASTAATGHDAAPSGHTNVVCGMADDPSAETTATKSPRSVLEALQALFKDFGEVRTHVVQLRPGHSVSTRTHPFVPDVDQSVRSCGAYSP